MHIEPLSRLPRPAWLRMRRALWPDGDDAEHGAEMQSLLGEPERFAQFVALDEQGAALGFVEASLRTDYVNGTDASPVAFLEGLYVEPGARRRGVARALVGAVIAWARGRGCSELASDTPVDNVESQSVHRCLGFHETERVAFFKLALEAAPHGPASIGQPGRGTAEPVDASADPLLVRPATADDALCLSVLAMQVFLDTYATQGIRPAIAREVLAAYSERAFAQALADPRAVLWVAEQRQHLVGFAHVTLGATQPLVAAGPQAELLRLYVQEPFTGQGVGTRLLAQAESVAAAAGARVLWLTPWVHNHRARAFYARRGYADLGLTHFVFEGESHENRVCAKELAAVRPAA